MPTDSTPQGLDDDEAPVRLASATTDRFQPSPLPPAAPDGGPVIPPAVHLPVMREDDSLCVVGPCRRYHRIVTPFEAAMPLDGSKTYADGTPIRPHRQVVPRCYPAPGREIDLGDTIVEECNLWDPLVAGDDEHQRLETRRQWALEARTLARAEADRRAEAEAAERELAAARAAVAAWERETQQATEAALQQVRRYKDELARRQDALRAAMIAAAAATTGKDTP